MINWKLKQIQFEYERGNVIESYIQHKREEKDEEKPDTHIRNANKRSKLESVWHAINCECIRLTWAHQINSNDRIFLKKENASTQIPSKRMCLLRASRI